LRLQTSIIKVKRDTKKKIKKNASYESVANKISKISIIGTEKTVNSLQAFFFGICGNFQVLW
jgi:hypothetical protein